jgi:methyl-accepting chemotaxis protein
MIRGIQQEMNAAVEAMQAGSQNVERGLESTTAAGDSLHEIISMSQQLSEVISMIDQAASRQLSSTEEIRSRVVQIAKITRETAQGAQESSKAVEELTHLALNLENLVGQFKISANNSHHEIAAN